MSTSQAQALPLRMRNLAAGDRKHREPAPLLWPVIAFIAGIWLAEMFTPLERPALIVVTSCMLLALASAAAVAILKRRRGDNRRGRFLGGLVLILAVGAGVLRHQAAVAKPPNHVTHLLADEPLLTRLVGDLESMPTITPGERHNPFIRFDPPARTQFIIAARELRTTSPPTPVCGLIRVTVRDEGLVLRLGERVQLTGRLYRPTPPRNPGEFDWARWNYLQGIEAGMVVEGAEHVRRMPVEPSWLARVVAGARLYAHLLLLGSYGDEPPDAAGRLLDTLVLGQRTAADRELNEAFLRAGGLHFLAVSGFNIAVLAGASCWVMRGVLRRSARTTAAVTLCAVVIYGTVAEPNAPIVRATVLGVLVALSGLARRQATIWNGLAASALCVLLVNPLELFRSGFQLSFVQVMALILLVGRAMAPNPTRFFERPREEEAGSWRAFIRMKLWREAVGLVVLSVIAWAVATPLVLFHYGRLAPWGFIGSPLLTIPVVLITWLGVLTIIMQALCQPAAGLVSMPLQWLTSGVLWAVHCFANLARPGVVELAKPPFVLVFGTYGLLGAAVAISGRLRLEQWVADFRIRRRARRRTLLVWSVTLGVLLLAWGGWLFWPRGARRDFALHVLSVGRGSAMMMITPAREAVLFDIGTDRNSNAAELVGQAAWALGVRRVAGVAVSHANFDHCSGLATALDLLSIDMLVLSKYTGSPKDTTPAALQALTPSGRSKLVRVHAGDSLTLAGMPVEVLWPPADADAAAWTANDLSLVLRVHAGPRTVLFTGDIEGRALRKLLAADAAGTIHLASDVLIAPHHGSLVPESAAFYAAVNPQVVVASSAEERPKLAALVDSALGAEARLLSTARSGAVTVSVQPDGELRLETAW